MLGACPLLSDLFPEKVGRYLFPPLADIYRIIAVVLGIVVFASVYSFHDLKVAKSAKGRVKALGCGIAVGLLGVFFFFILQERFVRSVDIPSLGKTIAVSVGFERSDFAKANFSNWSDWKILHDYGHHEEDIWKSWTPRSIIVARLMLFVSYLLFLLFAIATLSLEVLFQALGDAPDP